MQNELQAEIDAFHKKIRARALLIAVEWAGSASALAELLGYDRYTGTKWLQRGRLPVFAAVRIAALKGFPLSAQEMCPNEAVTWHDGFACPHCGQRITAFKLRRGCSPLLKDGRKSRVQKRRKQIEKRNAPSATK
jgi:transposase